MKAEQLNKTKIPVVKTDPSLNRFKGKVLFPEKLAKANETLKRVGMSAEYKPSSKYANDPVIVEKVKRMKKLIAKVGLPKEALKK